MRIGTLGAGDMGRTHAGVYAAMPDVDIAGIVSRTAAHAEPLAAKVGALAFTDPWALLDDDTTDAIDVTYPSALHREWTISALERGKHVFCETPMALTVEDTDAMIAAAHARGRILMPGSFPFTISLRVLCEDGALEAWTRLGPVEDFGLVRYPATGEPESLSLDGGDPYTIECRYFVRCVQREADPATIGPEGERDAIRVALAAQDALQQHKRITLHDDGVRA